MKARQPRPAEDRLEEEDAQLRGVQADLGLDWPGLAELDALGEEIGARMAESEAA